METKHDRQTRTKPHIETQTETQAGREEVQLVSVQYQR